MSVHLHRDDYPATLRLLERLVGHRADARGLGFDRSESGAFVSWDLLTCGKLSSTERGVALLAQGLATIEAHGGAGPLRDAALNACEAVL